MSFDFVPRLWSPTALGLALWFVGAGSYAQTAGLSQRFNASSNFPDQPRRSGYSLVNAFGTNTFIKPVCIAAPPGETNRVFVLEKAGIIGVVTNIGDASAVRSVYLDLQVSTASAIEAGLLGLAFHPGFQTNGYFYVYRTAAPPGATAASERVSRFQAIPPSAPTVSAETEVILFDQFDKDPTHNGGDLHFGSDGYLYVSVGDGGVLYGYSQTIRQGFASGILRIDVDNRPGNLPPNPPWSGSDLVVSTNYSVPVDNPFVTESFLYEVNPAVSTNSIRTEFWAAGLRNPWRFSIDEETGWIWAGDVGNTSYEEIDFIVKGGNYGWSFREGSGPPTVGLIDPIHQYGRWDGGTNTGNCVVGGVVYRGTNIPELVGAYVFCDYISGNIWSLRYDGSSVTDFRNLPQNGGILRELGIVAFGTDPRNRDILLADYDDGVIRRLVYTPDSGGSVLPPTLADSGIFSNLSPITASSGVVSYGVNVPAWSDGASGGRYFSIPNTNLAILWSATNNWLFPTSTVWVQNFSIPGSSPLRRIETRVLVRNAEGVYGASYRWGGSSSNAVLVSEQGAYDLISYLDVQGAPHTLNWIYPSQKDCQACHNRAAGWALGFNTAQLNLAQRFVGVPGATGATDNQLHTLAAVGYFSNSIPDPASLPALVRSTNQSASLESRVRSYLAANCAECHNPDSATAGFWDARYSVSTPQAALIWGGLRENFGNADSHVISPQSITNSMIYQRVAGLMGAHMPPLATTVLDTNSISLLAQWIGTLTDPVSLTIAPQLGGGQANLKWPYDSGIFDVYTATNLPALPWIRVPDSPSVSNGQWNLPVPMTGESSRFYRLQNR